MRGGVWSGMAGVIPQNKIKDSKYNEAVLGLVWLGGVRSGTVRQGKARNFLNKGAKTMTTEYIPKEESRPMWGQVVSYILARFETESYGLIAEHDVLKELMGILPATTIEESKK